jgi:hypothetical protein
VVKRFQSRPVFFFQSPAFASPECYIDNNRLIDPATGIDQNLFVTECLPLHRVEESSRLADPFSYIFHVTEFS